MEIQVLGPLRIDQDGVPLKLGGPKQRAVLAYFALNVGDVVTPAALAAAVWENNPPTGVTGTVQTYIFQLRQLLEPDRSTRQPYRVLRTVPAGYVLHPSAITIDSARFEQAIDRARAVMAAGQPAEAVREINAALALWRDRPLADLTGLDFVRHEADRLEAIYQDAAEIRLDAELNLGRHDVVVGELERHAAEHPERERTTALLMVALYRCGRQSEALAAYQRTRTALVERLGVEPAPPLRRLHERVLQQDPRLEAAANHTPLEPSPAPPAASGPRRIRNPLAAVTAVVTLSVVGLLLWAPRGGDRTIDSSATFHDYELLVRPGIAYDLDIPPGRPPDWHASNDVDSPDFRYTDLYRPTKGPEQISGVDVSGTDDYNVMQLVDRDADPAACRRLPTRGGGRVRLAGLEPGARMCLRTHDGRWAQITLLELPVSREAPVLLRVILLAD